ncbi:hypothetical protein AAES_125311 [Amazona aestiva]|uniref:Uncharacterized protein n=1 Tax=Amazona aestiva TaxID=12930 RepID=A0A0Q3TAL5_AMAAE|nr:hypothetical protein AAES_125311 [Amazona aestiva]
MSRRMEQMPRLGAGKAFCTSALSTTQSKRNDAHAIPVASPVNTSHLLTTLKTKFSVQIFELYKSEKGT